MSLGSFIKSLLKKKPENAQELLDLFNCSQLTLLDILPYNTYNHLLSQSYGRKCIWKNNEWKIFVLSWNSGDFSAIHGHECIDFGLLKFYGTADHRTYKYKDKHLNLELAERIPEGTAKLIEDSDFYHSMGNLGKEPFLTFHIYKCCTDNEKLSSLINLENNTVSYTERAAFLNTPVLSSEKNTKDIYSSEEVKKDYILCTKSFYKRIGKIDILNELTSNECKL